MINEAVWVGPGTAARNTSRASRRESIKIGSFSQDNILIATPWLLPTDLVETFSGSALVRKHIDHP